MLLVDKYALSLTEKQHNTGFPNFIFPQVLNSFYDWSVKHYCWWVWYM